MPGTPDDILPPSNPGGTEPDELDWTPADDEIPEDDPVGPEDIENADDPDNQPEE